MPISLAVAFLAAYPVNRYLLQSGNGHALMHEHHGSSSAPVVGVRRFIPTLQTTTLIVVIAAFVVGGLTVSVADELAKDGTTSVVHTSWRPGAARSTGPFVDDFS